jgi:hypothetical protein
MCIKDTKLRILCNYYNFTLRQAVANKKARGARFREPELIYIMHCLLDLALGLKASGVVLGDYRSDAIFLSPAGLVKVYSLDIERGNKHTAYYQALTDKSLVGGLVLAPEQLLEIGNLEYEPLIDLYKVEVFAIAMVVLELASFSPAGGYYTEDKTGIKMEAIGAVLSACSAQYSRQFLTLLWGCLAHNQGERASLEEAFRGVEHLREQSQNVSYCVKLHEDEKPGKEQLKNPNTQAP